MNRAMIFTSLFVFLCTLFPYEVYADYETLGDFRDISINNTLVYLQEDPLFFVRFLSDIVGNLEPFGVGLFGYNRLRIAELANDTLTAIDTITRGKSLDRKQNRCIQDNKKILTLIMLYAISDWQCIRVHLIDLGGLLQPLWETLFGFSLVHEEDCWFGPFCLLSKGFETARLTAQMVEHGAKLLKFAADFVLELRLCQRKIKPFENITNRVLENMRICVTLN